MAEEFQVGNNSNWWDTSRNNTRCGENGDETSSTSATLNSTSSSGWPRKTSQSLPIHQEYPGSLRAGGRGGGGQPNLQMMGLGLSSEAMDWNNQPVFRDENADGNATSFRWMLEDQMSSNTYFHDHESADQYHWRQKLHDKPCSDSEATYEDQSSLLALDNHHHPSNSYQTSYSSWNNPSNNNVCCKFPQFIVRGTSPSKQQHYATGTGQVQFSNHTLFWNTTTAAINDVRSSFVPLLQTQVTTPTIDEQQKTETSNKRSRSESSSHSPAFKVRKEKMGDRINALQQLVSPFGKTDTASVLSEAIEYIKFLHDQVNVLTTPYMRNGALVQNQKHLDNKAKDTEDLRSRGLCLVPLSTTFWIPTFGPTFT